MTDGRADGADAEEPVDPRYDPRFQRGYDPRQQGAAPRSPESADPLAARGIDPHSPYQRGGDPREPDRYADRRDLDPLPSDPRDDHRRVGSTPATPSARADASPDDRAGFDAFDDVGDPEVRHGSRVWVTVLAVVSAIGVVAGVIAVAALTTQAPLRFETAANSATAAGHFALELVGGPVLVAGLLGAAVALALFVTAPRRGPVRHDDGDDDADPEPPPR